VLAGGRWAGKIAVALQAPGGGLHCIRALFLIIRPIIITIIIIIIIIIIIMHCSGQIQYGKRQHGVTADSMHDQLLAEVWIGVFSNLGHLRHESAVRRTFGSTLLNRLRLFNTGNLLSFMLV